MRSSPAPRPASAGPRPPRSWPKACASREAPGGSSASRRRSRSRSTSPTPPLRPLRHGGGRASGRPRHPRQQRRPRVGPRTVRRVERGGRGDRLRRQRRRARPDDAALPAALRRLGPHREHGLGRGPPGVRGRRVVRRGEVRRARLHVRPSRGSPRPADPHHDGRSRPDETDFSLVRFKGDEEKAAAVYRGVEPLRPDDIADCIVFALTRPWHVNVDEIVVKARNQSSGARILRDE